MALKNNLFKILVLVAIICFAVFLYFYKLGEIPNGFYVDEASPAYNAISILETGKDEYGFSYPLVFRQLGSYSPPTFIYVSSVLIRFFGSSPVVFRSFTAISMLIGIVIFYLLIRKLDLYKLEISYFVITFFYSISPWIVFNARLGYETTLGFIIFNIGTFFLFQAIKEHKNLIPAILFLSLSTYVSHNQRFLSPLFLATFLVLFRKTIFLKKNIKTILTALFVGLAVNIPNLYLMTTNSFWIKGSQFNINYFWKILTYLSPKTLFFENPDIDMQHTIPKLSMMYNWMVVPYFVGIYVMINKIKDFRYKFLILYFTISLIPSIFSSQFVSSQRVLPLSIPMFVIVGMGIDEVIKYFRLSLRIVALILVSLYSLLMLYTSYFVLFPKERALGWSYGYNHVAEYIGENPDKNFLVDDTRNPRAYILLLYFLKVPPKEYQKEVDSFYKNNYYHAPPPALSYRFSNVEVRQINWETDPKKDIIIIGDNLAISDSQAKEHKLVKIDEIKDPLMNTIFVIYKTSINE